MGIILLYPYVVCYYQRSVRLQYSKYHPSQIFRTIPNDCKNLMFDAVSFFLLNDRMFLIPLAKNMSLICFACQFKISILCYHCRNTLSLSPPYMLSNSDLRENRAIIYNAKCQIRNAPYDDRKINNLCQSFRYLISSVARSAKTRVHTLVDAVCTRDHVAFNANDVYVDDIYRFVRFMPLSWF